MISIMDSIYFTLGKIQNLLLDYKMKLIPSMLLFTVAICVLTTFLPQLMPLWMNVANRAII
jgi:hypothetical protein